MDQIESVYELEMAYLHLFIQILNEESESALPLSMIILPKSKEARSILRFLEKTGKQRMEFQN